MLKKIAAVIQQIPHWAIGVGLVVSLFGPQLVSLFTALNMPAYAATTQQIVAALLAVIAWIKQANSIAAKGDSPVAREEAKKASIHPPSLPKLPVLMLCLGICGCTTQQALSNIQASAPAFQCVLGEIFKGDNNPITIAKACDGIAAADIIAIINAELSALEYPSGGDAGAGGVPLKVEQLRTAKANAGGH